MTGTLPLQGVRVVSLAVNLPGPLAAARLAEFGADVVKVEPPAGDPLDHQMPLWYAELIVGQTVMRLDLKDHADREKLDGELAESDVLLTSYRPSALRRLGLTDVCKRHPRLSHVEIVGHAGEAAEIPGHDLTYQAAYATVSPPTMPTVPVADMIGAERAVSATVLALHERTKTGVGQHNMVVLEDAAVFAGAAVRHGLMGPGAPLGGADAAYGLYATADGWIALAALEPHFRDRTRDALGATTDSREEYEAIFATQPTKFWEELAQRVDIPLARVAVPTRGETQE
ncbi:CaiB/BaiF CoA-transferase family protein [Gordonia sp. CPCC 205515]|uniref:CoA transferase n=1 Tax=Gordonia sp. CPCC 205515 TaxID=3140791 RepID=UPI003AF34E3D